MTKDTGKILVVDDDEGVLQAAQLLLKQHYETVHCERDPERIPGRMKGNSYDVILLDMNFSRNMVSGQEGFSWLERIQRVDPAVVVILITAFGDTETAVRAIKEGATDFILKPWQNDKLLATVSAALNLRRSRHEIEHLRFRQDQLCQDLDSPFKDFIGISEPMRRVFQTIEKVGKTDVNVLITGENGTGKELVARALHRSSSRSGEVFISLDMGSISENLFESELFGHVKGAFTDARQDRAGRFEIASGGTLFFDEIGNLPLTLQPKILRVLETRLVTRVGSNKPVPVDVRLICASNMPLPEMVDEKTFRQDLLYRINTVELHIPPLRERTEDIPVLAAHFSRLFSRRYQKSIRPLSSASLKKISSYHWPGNVRELKHAIERAVILNESGSLSPEDFLFERKASRADDSLSLNDFHLDAVESAVIRKVLTKHSGNISLAAEELGLSRAALYRRLEKYGI